MVTLMPTQEVASNNVTFSNFEVKLYTIALLTIAKLIRNGILSHSSFSLIPDI